MPAPLRIVYTGRHGQVATALSELAPPPGVELIALGRSELDLDRPETVAAAISAARPDVVISAAAYTAVDKAESEPDEAMRANATSAGEIAAAAARLGVPVLHLSTDYVFDGAKPAPYVEDDPTAPTGVYGATKLEGEQAVMAAQPNSLVLRTAWVHAPYGRNFVRTMLALAQTREEVSVVADQRGCPTYAPELAAALLTLALAAKEGAGTFGVFHLAGAGEASWAEFASAVFAGSAARGGPHARVRPITTADYRTPARRPANSRLDGSWLARDWGVALGDWRTGLEAGLDRLVGPRLSSDPRG